MKPPARNQLTFRQGAIGFALLAVFLLFFVGRNVCVCPTENLARPPTNPAVHDLTGTAHGRLPTGERYSARVPSGFYWLRRTDITPNHHPLLVKLVDEATASGALVFAALQVASAPGELDNNVALWPKPSSARSVLNKRVCHSLAQAMAKQSGVRAAHVQRSNEKECSWYATTSDDPLPRQTGTVVEKEGRVWMVTSAVFHRPESCSSACDQLLSSVSVEATTSPGDGRRHPNGTTPSSLPHKDAGP
jgi:hypothetical protein